MREGVKALIVARVLEIRRGDGTYVAGPTPGVLLEHLAGAVELLAGDTLVELIETRRLLEPAATGLGATRIDDAALAEPADHLDAMRASLHTAPNNSTCTTPPSTARLHPARPRPARDRRRQHRRSGRRRARGDPPDAHRPGLPAGPGRRPDARHHHREPAPDAPPPTGGRRPGHNPGGDSPAGALTHRPPRRDHRTT
ncbi:FadR/GntR family transcriptional regulator [Kitasatospora purpeofusca]|uniref:FadR/GntR family transcriptional regulator n=1 Tax=Kitasatospora purpeofusca TaxID=67352 RepID=UPI0035DC6C37